MPKPRLRKPRLTWTREKTNNMIITEVQRDRVEVWQRRKSGIPGGKDVITATIFPLPIGADIRQFETPDGTVTIDTSYENVNPAKEAQRAVIKGPHTGGEIQVNLINGQGRVRLNLNIEVVFDISRLTRALEADNRRAQSRSGW